MALHSGVTDEQFIALWRETGGRAKLVAQSMGVALRNVYERRNKIEKRHGLVLPSAGDDGKKKLSKQLYRKGHLVLVACNRK